VSKIAAQRPGPGYYKAPSEFGLYDGDVYNYNKELPSKSNKIRSSKAQ
jgi:hypothetical protein